MATEYKRMMQRYGTYSEYLAHAGELLPNEFAFIVSGCPYTDDGQAIYARIGTNQPKLITSTDSAGTIAQKIAEQEMYPVYATNALNPDFTKTYITETVGSGTLYGTDGNGGYYRLAANAFNKDYDGLLITRNRQGTTKFIESPYYTIYADSDYFPEGSSEIHGDSIVAFGNVGFLSTDSVRFWLYKKPYVQSTQFLILDTTKTQAQYDALTVKDPNTLYIIQEASS